MTDCMSSVDLALALGTYAAAQDYALTACVLFAFLFGVFVPSAVSWIADRLRTNDDQGSYD